MIITIITQLTHRFCYTTITNKILFQCVFVTQTYTIKLENNIIFLKINYQYNILRTYIVP